MGKKDGKPSNELIMKMIRVYMYTIHKTRKENIDLIVHLLCINATLVQSMICELFIITDDIIP